MKPNRWRSGARRSKSWASVGNARGEVKHARSLLRSLVYSLAHVCVGCRGVVSDEKPSRTTPGVNARYGPAATPLPSRRRARDIASGCGHRDRPCSREFHADGLSQSAAARRGRPDVRGARRGVSVARRFERHRGRHRARPRCRDRGAHLDCPQRDPRIVRNEDPSRGQLSSLWTGLDACPADTEAIAVTLVDVPMLAPSTVSAVVDHWMRTRAPIVRPEYRRPARPSGDL